MTNGDTHPFIQLFGLKEEQIVTCPSLLVRCVCVCVCVCVNEGLWVEESSLLQSSVADVTQVSWLHTHGLTHIHTDKVSQKLSFRTHTSGKPLIESHTDKHTEIIKTT